jgi:hypothetical protein
MLLRLSAAHSRTLDFYPTPPASSLPRPLRATGVTHLLATLTSLLTSVGSKALSSPESLPQPLYLQHLQPCLISVASRGLISPLNATLTEFSLATLVDATLTEITGGRVGPNNPPLVYPDPVGATRHSSLPLVALTSSFSTSSKLFCTFLHSPKMQVLSFHANPHSCQKTPGDGVPTQAIASLCELSAVHCQLFLVPLVTRHSPLAPSSHDQTTHL